VLNFVPDRSVEAVDADLAGLGKRTAGRWVRELLPERLAEGAVCARRRGSGHTRVIAPERSAAGVGAGR
jgi:hypothetical protein